MKCKLRGITKEVCTGMKDGLREATVVPFPSVNECVGGISL
ncbi:hypothetical protein ACFLTZ_06775 [Chloroflexota bacterium]